MIATKDATVTAETNRFKEFNDELMKDPEKLNKFLRAVMGPSKRLLEGAERDHMLTVFKLIEPARQTNNQRSFTDEYVHAGKMYDVTYFEDEVIVEEYLENDI